MLVGDQGWMPHDYWGKMVFSVFVLSRLAMFSSIQLSDSHVSILHFQLETETWASQHTEHSPQNYYFYYETNKIKQKETSSCPNRNLKTHQLLYKDDVFNGFHKGKALWRFSAELLKSSTEDKPKSHKKPLSLLKPLCSVYSNLCCFSTCCRKVWLWVCNSPNLMYLPNLFLSIKDPLSVLHNL